MSKEFWMITIIVGMLSFFTGYSSIYTKYDIPKGISDNPGCWYVYPVTPAKVNPRDK